MLLEGGYGYSEFFDNLTDNDLFEMTLTPHMNTQGAVDAVQMREVAGQELERQFKKYRKDGLSTPLHAHDGIEGGVDNEIYQRAYTLKPKGDVSLTQRYDSKHSLRRFLICSHDVQRFG
eukprot:COSAG01_NODE_613_length_14831_cov_8.108675_7_plen_119_part_00